MNVLSIYVDNAANMTCAVRHFNDTDILESKIKTISQENYVTGEYCEEINFDVSDQWIENPNLILPSWLLGNDSRVQLIMCGVHTLQLAILGGLKMEYSQIILTKIR